MASSQTPTNTSTGNREAGSRNYTEILKKNIGRFLLANLLTILFFAPFAAGVMFSITRSDWKILVIPCILGGCIAGPALSCMYDTIFRALRNDENPFWQNYTKAWKQNWKQSLLPGVLFCSFLGATVYLFLKFFWKTQFPGWVVTIIFLIAVLLLTMFFTGIWPQIALLDIRMVGAVLNSLIILLTFLPKILQVTLMQLAYWSVLAALIPYSAVLLLIAGFWFILYTVNYMIYGIFNINFHIEERLSGAAPASSEPTDPEA